MIKSDFPFDKGLTNIQVLKLLLEQELSIRKFRTKLESVGFDSDAMCFDLGAIILSLSGRVKRSDLTWYSYENLIDKYSLTFDDKVPNKGNVDELYNLILKLPE